ncbi:hypothetical protein C9374_001012 [Naegleria lovaniensis]|uniref:glutaminase n=1 Tax=Naegleria lovaniensis TaxID=51637 RepID=A0AA88GSN6_NAELO|nr:uncharacterized protein C9374_001012 [Naegleria lovaniensis]KAG2388162.1 hypothetical protein C9374_001012 [Naegleria lovaniensis]
MKDRSLTNVDEAEADTPLHLIHPPNHHHHNQTSPQVSEMNVYDLLDLGNDSKKELENEDQRKQNQSLSLINASPATSSSSSSTTQPTQNGNNGSSNTKNYRNENLPTASPAISGTTTGRSPDAFIQSKFEQERNSISQLFSSLDKNKKGFVTIGDLEYALKKEGLDSKYNPDLSCIIQQLAATIVNGMPSEKSLAISDISEEYRNLEIDFDTFYNIIQEKDNIISRALTGRLAITDWRNFCAEIEKIFEETRPLTDGNVATYIPQLAEVNPNYYGLSICTVDGQRFSVGDCDVDFTIQSCSKVFTYCLVCEDRGADNVHQYVGFEPSGVSFNAFTLDEHNKPHNPMINAGAITVCSLVKPELSPSKRFTYISSKFSRFAGGSKIGFDNATFLSEKSTGDRNFALAYYMEENNVFPEGSNIEDTLDLYFQQCSILVNCNSLATMAATLANGGTCPLTNEIIVSADTVKCALQLMLSCGMYDFSGNWSCTVGLPAKSGVAGAICIVIPSVMGMCIFSPRLDKRGNSVRGVEFCKRASDKFEWSLFDRLVPNPVCHSPCVDNTNEKASTTEQAVMDQDQKTKRKRTNFQPLVVEQSSLTKKPKQ